MEKLREMNKSIFHDNLMLTINEIIDNLTKVLKMEF